MVVRVRGGTCSHTRWLPWPAWLLLGLSPSVNPCHRLWAGPVPAFYPTEYDKVADVTPTRTLHCTRLFHASRLSSLSLSLCLSIADFDESSCHKSYSHKEMNSGNKLREFGSRSSQASSVRAQPWPTCRLQPCDTLSRPAEVGQVGGGSEVLQQQQEWPSWRNCSLSWLWWVHNPNVIKSYRADYTQTHTKEPEDNGKPERQGWMAAVSIRWWRHWATSISHFITPHWGCNSQLLEQMPTCCFLLL